MVIISGDIYSLADGNKKFIVKMLIEGISIRHFHQLENHLPKFQQKKLLKANEFGLIPEPFIVCADGSSASYFSMRRPKNSWLDISKYSFRIKEGNVSDLRRVGMISTPVKTLDSIIVKYTHPQFINDDSNHPVFAVFTLQVINDDLDIVEYEIPIQVYRPPVLMVHGIWSNGQAAFGVMGQALLSSNAYVNEQVNILDYEGSNDVSFELNKIIVPYHIAKTIEDIVAKGWSVGKVDVVCHSMGGNLTRNYLQRDYYFNDINKLITCNTPHSGTQATNLIFSNDGENIRKILKSYDFDFNAGAVSDLKVNSAAIFKMNNPPELNRHTVPSHSITTTATAEDIPEFEPYLKKLPKYFSELLEKALIGQTLEELYGEQHDNVVPISSQSGGLIGFSTSKIDNQFHQGSTSNPDVIEKVIELLKVDPVESSNFEFYGFNPVELEFPDGLKPQTEIGGKSLLSVSILNPVKGIEVSPGSILPIEIQGSSELTNIILFVEYSKDEFYAAALNSSNGLFNFEVDGDYLGKRNIIAIGIDASSQEMVIDSSYIIVKPSTPNFLGFTVEPNQIKILKYQTASVSVKGTYIDGLTGDIVTSDVTKLHEIQLEVLEGKAMVTNKKRLFGQSIGDDDLIVLYNGISVASATIEIEDSELFDFIDVDGDGYSEMQGDCDDNNSAIFPGAPELCNNLDDNCNGTVDEDATYAPTWYADADGDGFGDADNAQQSCLQPNGFVNNPLDCDDGDINVNPIASEMCNTIDDDCDGEVDEYATDAPTWYEDADGDGFGNQYVILVQCSQPEGYVSNLDDCNDEDPSLNPNTVWYADIDGDGFGDPENSLTICEAGPFYVLNDDDCDDLVMAINPGALESCNGTDDNCDGVTDEGFDMDTDGYTVCQNDCDDNAPAINPGVTEVCNGTDDNCDGSIDEGFDMDGDGYSVCQNDCDDNDPAINPGALEICNGIDDDCDVLVDTDDTNYSDDTPPIAHCKNVTVNLGENGTVSITPQQINDGSTDNCGPVTLTVDPSVLDCSNVGTTIVTLTAEDGKGNNHTCDAIVTVLLDPATVIAYTLLAQEEIQMKNTIVNGNVGLGQAGKKTKIKEFSTVNGFVKSPQIELDNNSSITGSQYFNQAPEPLSTTFKYNTQTDPSSDINIPDNYSGVYQLTGNLFRKIEVGKNSTIKFMSSGEIFIKEFKTKDSDTGNHSSVLFSDNTELVVRKKLDLGKRTEFNWVGGHKVKVYVEEEDVKVNESSKVNASIDVRFKKMSVEDAKEANHTLMNGQFIANKIDSRKWVDWDWSPFECENELPPSNNLVLPNDFLGLDATLQDIHVQLLWLTNKTGEYEVERSLDGVNFVALISKQNNSASSAVQFHDYDESPVEGVNYYRIKRINPDGSFTFSPIRQVNFNLESDFTIFPNPASDEVRLYLDRFIGKEEVDVIIVNTMGTVLFKQQLPIVEDKILPIRLDRNRFIDGLYSVSVVYRGRAQSKRLVVARF